MEAFEDLYSKYSPRIFRVCMGYTGDAEQARDLTQETFIAVWQHLASFRGQSHISTWIYRIATNHCLRAIERSKRMDMVELPVNLPDLEEEHSAKSREAKLNFLYQCISALEETDRIMISLVLEEVPQAQIAEIVGLSPVNTRVRIHRIKEKLAVKFKAYGQFE